ncbi:MAG: sulfotransferase domain-containing protein [Thiogranum sp.]
MGFNPIIFVAGMPRSGSMWTYNVCRKLIQAAGKTPWPDSVPLDETPVIQEALSRPPAPDQMYCIKTHFQVPVGQEHMRIICNYRDIRDAMLSYMRFMKCSFEKGLSVAKGSMSLTDHYLRSRHPHVLPVCYDALTLKPQETIRDLMGFLSLRVKESDIEAIALEFSREEVARRLKKLESVELDNNGNVQSESGSAEYSSAQNLDGSFRVYDHATGFQTNHISSGRDGEWRSVLSGEEQAELMAATSEWLARYGFRL